MLRKLRIYYFVVQALQVVTLEHINDFKHEHSTCFRVDALSFYLVALVIRQKLLFCLQFSPNLVQDAIGHEKIIHTEFKLEKFLTVRLNVMPHVKNDH